MDNNQEYLVHHGVKGMKWGVHKKLEELADASSGAANEAEEEAIEAIADNTTVSGAGSEEDNKAMARFNAACVLGNGLFKKLIIDSDRSIATISNSVVRIANAKVKQALSPAIKHNVKVQKLDGKFTSLNELEARRKK